MLSPLGRRCRATSAIRDTECLRFLSTLAENTDMFQPVTPSSSNEAFLASSLLSRARSFLERSAT